MDPTAGAAAPRGAGQQGAQALRPDARRLERQLLRSPQSDRSVRDRPAPSRVVAGGGADGRASLRSARPRADRCRRTRVAGQTSMAAADLIPVNIVTGFLGSGKTTLLQRLLTFPELANTAVLVNELGEVGLDHLLLRHVDETTVVLPSGCVCCALRADLTAAIRDLYSKRERGTIPRFDRLIIETTGFADPAPIIFTLMAEPVLRHHFQVGHVVTTVDAVNGTRHLAHDAAGCPRRGRPAGEGTPRGSRRAHAGGHPRCPASGASARAPGRLAHGGPRHASRLHRQEITPPGHRTLAGRFQPAGRPRRACGVRRLT